MEVPTDCSKVWGSIINHRRYARRWVVHQIQDGTYTWFWHDLWCGSTPLIENEEAMQMIKLLGNARVCMAINEGRWNDTITGVATEDTGAMIFKVEINQEMVSDKVIWSPSTSGKFIHSTVI